MTFTLTPLSHYNSITEPHAHFLLFLMEDLTINIPSHFIISIINVYQDTATHDKLIFPLAITRILQHFSIPIPLSPFYTIIGPISIGSVQRSEAQLQPKRPWVEMTDLATFIVPPSSLASSISASSSSATGNVTLKAIMEQLQQMQANFGGRLDYLTNDMCQMNTQVGHIARQRLTWLVLLLLTLLLQRPRLMIRLMMIRMMLTLLVMIRWRPFSDLSFVIRDKNGE